MVLQMRMMIIESLDILAHTRDAGLDMSDPWSVRWR